MHSDRAVTLAGTAFVIALVVCIVFFRHIILSSFFLTDLEREEEAFYSAKYDKVTPLAFEAYSLGFSMARGFNFETLGIDGLHMYDSSGSYQVAFLKLKGLLRQSKAPKFILLPITETALNLPTSLSDQPLIRVASFLRNTNHPFEFWREDPIRTFSAVLSKFSNEKRELRYLSHALVSNRQMKNSGTSKDACDRGWNEMYALRQPANGSFLGHIDWFPSPECWRQQLSKVSAQFAARTGGTQENIKKNLLIIADMAQLSQEAESRLVLVRMPIARELHGLISKIQTLDSVEQRLGMIPNISYLDFEKLLHQVPEDRIYFTDPVHLNRLGSEIFSDRLADELRADFEE